MDSDNEFPELSDRPEGFPDPNRFRCKWFDMDEPGDVGYGDWTTHEAAYQEAVRRNDLYSFSVRNVISYVEERE